MNSSLRLLLLLLGTCVCLAENPKDTAPLIINGATGTDSSVPHQAYLDVTLASSSRICGGSIISAQYVITAAHCVQNAISVTVILGQADITNPIQTRTLSPTEITIHPNFNADTLENDLAILDIGLIPALPTTAKIIQMTNEVNPAVYRWKQATISGWGQTSDNGANVNVLNVATVRIMMDLICRKLVWLNNKVRPLNTRICTQTIKAALCLNDAGGPLTLKDNASNLLIGVASGYVGRQGSCSKARADVFMFIGAYRSWIRDVTGV